jgi:hypothetical protein
MGLGEFERHLWAKKFQTEHMLGYPRDALVGRVLLIHCFARPLPHTHRHRWVRVFEQPELFLTPIPCRGAMSYFHLPREIAQQLPPRYEYRD